jgi:hypothetical protein
MFGDSVFNFSIEELKNSGGAATFSLRKVLVRAVAANVAFSAKAGLSAVFAEESHCRASFWV